MAKVLPVALALGSLVLAGCVSPLTPAGTAPPLVEDLLGRLTLLDGGFEIEAPVHVLLIGFAPGTAAAVQAALSEPKIEHEYLDFARDFPPSLPTEEVGGTVPMPVVPVAQYRIHDASPELAAAFFAAVKPVEGADGIYDANAAEEWLAANLPAAGFPVDPATPAMVLLHASAQLGEHGWRTTFPQGYLEPVRVFGERTPLLVMDVSAIEDPYVTTAVTPPARVPSPVPLPIPPSPVASPFPTQPVEREAYNYPLESNGADAVDVLALAITDATHFRLLQSSIYPITTKPCHAVTLVLALRGYSLAEAMDLKAESYLSLPTLQGAFDNLTGKGNTIVDLKVLNLPQDDPALEAVIPRSALTLDAFRYWVDMNWDQYWVPHDGCEPYVSFLVSGDRSDFLGFGGIALYGVKDTHRMSFSVIDDLRRIREDERSPLAGALGDAPGLTQRPESIQRYDIVNRLYAHETGHLMGQHHPHNVIRTDDGTPTTPAFSAVWSVMSYQNRERVTDFGAIDHANYMRNRAGFVVQAAIHGGLQNETEFQEALQLLAEYRWQEAGDLLVPLLAEGHSEDCAAARAC